MKTIVLGGGVIGTTTAYYLAKPGTRCMSSTASPTWRWRRASAMAACCTPARPSRGRGPACRATSSPGSARRTPRCCSASARCRRCGAGASPSSATARSSAIAKPQAINLRLANHTLAAIKEIRAETGIEYDLSQKGTLKIYTRRKRWTRTSPNCELHEAARPGLRGGRRRRAASRSSRRWRRSGSTLVGGIYAPPDEHGDCHKFSVGLRRIARRSSA